MSITSPPPFNWDCVANPINDISRTITQAKSGIDRSTGKICVEESEAFSTDAIMGRVDELSSLSFECYPNSPMCNGSDAPIELKYNKLIGNTKTSFRAIISCNKQDKGYDCTISIKSPED